MAIGSQGVSTHALKRVESLARGKPCVAAGHEARISFHGSVRTQLAAAGRQRASERAKRILLSAECSVPPRYATAFLWRAGGVSE